MRIAQVSPLHESVPPRTYGGTERIVSYLTEALIDLGHEVTLFAAGDSRTRADLYSMVPKALRLAEFKIDPVIPHLMQIAEVARMADRFDVIHFHTDFLHYPLFRKIAVPSVTTHHGRLDLPELNLLYEEFHDVPVISISNSQRAPLPHANWVDTVYNGVPAGSYDLRVAPGEYLAFVGRISPEKGVEQAIEIALRLGLPLKLAAKIDVCDRDYYEQRVRPLLERHPSLEYIGEVDEHQKNVLLGGARALLFPIQWPEPFGLVMIEAMACGTPVVAFRRGSVTEVMRPGVTGIVVESVDEAVERFSEIDAIDRAGCRAWFESRFSAQRMAEAYLATYERLLANRRTSAVSNIASGGRSLSFEPAALPETI